MPVKRDYLTIGFALVLALSLRGLPDVHKYQIAAYSRLALLSAGQWLFSRAISHARNQE